MDAVIKELLWWVFFLLLLDGLEGCFNLLIRLKLSDRTESWPEIYSEVFVLFMTVSEISKDVSKYIGKRHKEPKNFWRIFWQINFLRCSSVQHAAFQLQVTPSSCHHTYDTYRFLRKNISPQSVPVLSIKCLHKVAWGVLLWLLTWSVFYVHGPKKCLKVVFDCRLDPALIRPGRVDLKEYIGHVSEYQLRRLFQRFYPDQKPVKSDMFAKMVSGLGHPISAAQIQGFFLMFKHNSDELFKNIGILSPIAQSHFATAPAQAPFHGQGEMAEKSVVMWLYFIYFFYRETRLEWRIVCCCIVCNRFGVHPHCSENSSKILS